MRADRVRRLALLLVVVSLGSSFFPVLPRARADPFVTPNGDGTSTAVWNFTNPADYTLAATAISGGTAALAPQTTSWSSTTAGDFAGPDSEANVDRATWPGDVALASTSGPMTSITLQPGATGEDAWLDRQNTALNHGGDTTLILDGSRNPNKRPILRFDLTTIPAGAVIDDAILGLYESTGVGNSFTATAHEITADWNEMQATWNNRLTGTPWGLAGGDFAGHVIGTAFMDNTAGWRSFNVTQLVDLWYRGRLPNYGFLITNPNTGALADKTLYSSEYAVDPTLRPKLDIRYRVLGSSGTYVSRVGGPGTPAFWQTISWNGTERSLVSDEFAGAPLAPKWAWTNPPASYDVGATTPGALHVVSSTGVDFAGATFTGNVLANDVVGDFTATMQLSATTAAVGQKAGLMVLLSPRDWYAAWKMNAGGLQRWRVSATADAVTTARVDVNNGNPVPAWLRIQRVGNAFTASTSTDGMAWTVRDTYAPAFEFPLSVRLALTFADGGSGTALATDVDYLRVALGNDATVAVSTRTGDVAPVDGTWSAFTAPYPTPSGSAMAGASRYVEYRLAFAVTYPDHTPVVGDVNVSWSRYVASGTIETNDLVLSDLAAWGPLTTVDAPNGQTIAYAYSLDSGGSWTPVAPPADLSAVSTATGTIRFRVSLSTSNTLVTPSVSGIRLTYTHTLDHFYVTAPPSAGAGAAFTVTVTAKDAANVTITSWVGTVALAARLADGVTPGGGTLGTTSLAITSGGTATLATETYTKAETIRVRASFASAAGLSGLTAIAPGAVTRVLVSPPSATLLPFDVQTFTGTAFDAYDNVVPGTSFNWTVFGGVGSLNSSTGPNVRFTASPPPANGTLRMAFGALSASAPISVVSGIPPWVSIGSPLPGAHVTGAVPITYTNSSDAISLRLEYDAGAGWTLIGSTGVLNGTYVWNTAPLDFAVGSLRAIATNNRTISNTTVVTPIEVDNTAPTIGITSVTDNQATGGTLTIGYATDADVVRVDLTYYDGAWKVAGTDLTVDGSFVWTPGVPINGVTLRAVARDEVGLAGADARQGVGTYVVGSNPPTIAAIPDLHVRVGAAYRLNLTFYVSDPDTPLASLAIWDSDAANVTANAGAAPSLDVTFGAAGTYLVTLWASDGTDTAWRVVRIVASGQSPPTLVVPVPSVSFDEDTTLLDAFGAPATAFFDDVDGDPLTFTILDGVRVASRVNANDTVDLWALPNWFGGETLRIRASDPSGGFAEVAFAVTVRPIDDAPVLVSAFPAVAFDEDVTLLDAFGGNATVHFADVDGDALALSVLGGANVSARVNPGGTIDFWAAANWSGAEALRVRATDPSGLFVEGAVLVTVRAVNDAPIIASPLPAIAFDEDTVRTDALGGPAAPYFLDREGQALTFSILGATEVRFRINRNGTIDLWATVNWSGAEGLSLRATDPAGGFADAPLPVTVRPVNDAPALAVLPALRLEEGVAGSLDLVLYVTDSDTPASSLVVAADSPYVQVSGLVLTLAFPSNVTETQFTVTVSDGLLAASQPVRVTIVPPLWKPVAYTVTPLVLAVVVGVFVQRARWRPTKAFLVDEKRQMLREFTLDRTCDVTFEQVVGAGALDAVDKAVKVSKYHAQTVRGDALAITLLAYGPVTAEQIEFAREMLVNVQDKFEDRVKARLDEARGAETGLAEREASLAGARAQFDARSRAFSELVDATNTARSKMAEEAALLHISANAVTQREAELGALSSELNGKSEELAALNASLDARSRDVGTLEADVQRRSQDLDARESRLAPVEAEAARRESAVADREAKVGSVEQTLAAKTADLEAKARTIEQRESAWARDRLSLDQARDAFEAQRRDFESRSSEIEEALRRARATLEEQEKALAVRQTQVAEDVAKFDAVRTEKMQFIASKDIELEARQHTLNETEGAIRTQAEANAKQLADLAAREEAHEIEGDRLERLRTELEGRKEELQASSAALEVRTRALHDLEAKNAAAFRTWQETMESQQRVLKEERDALDQETHDQRAAIAQKKVELDAFLRGASEREAQARAAIESAMRMEDRAKAREVAADEATGAATVLKEQLTIDRAALDRASADLAARERAIVDEADRRAQDVQRREEALRAAQAALDARQGDLERDWAAREAHVKAVEADAARKVESLEEKSLALVTKEGELSSIQESLDRDRTDLARLSQEVEAKRIEAMQAAERNGEEAVRLKAEESAWRQSLAEKEAWLKAEQERVERESHDLQATLGTRAEALAAKEKALDAREQEILSKGQEADARARDIAFREHQLAERGEDLAAKEAALARARADLDGRAAEQDAAARRFASEQEEKRKEWTSLESVLQSREAQSKSEAEQRLAQIAAKAAELETREREITATIVKLDDQRSQFADRERALAGMESEAKASRERAEQRAAELLATEAALQQNRQAFEAERAAWGPRRDQELKQLEATRDAAADQSRRAEQLLEEANRRTAMASEAEAAAKRRLTEASELQSQLETRRAEVEAGERALESESAKIQEASRTLAARELETANRLKEVEAGRAKLDAATQASAAAERAFASTKAAVEQEAARVQKLSAELEATKADVEAKVADVKARLVGAGRLEQELKARDTEVRTREAALTSGEREVRARAEELAKQESTLAGKTAEFDRARLDVEGLTAKADEDRRIATQARAEAEAMHAKAEQDRAKAEAQQAELQKSMKFLQKKALETLDLEEKVRKREAEFAERDRILESKFEIVDGKEASLEIERQQVAEKTAKLEAEVEKLRARLAEAEKGGKPAADLEERSKDLEKRLKIIQQKAMELLDREDKLRTQEAALQEKAQKPS